MTNSQPLRTRRGPAKQSELIYSLRTQLGLDQQRLAVFLGVSMTSISRWEQGTSTMNASASTLIGVLDRAVKCVGADAVLQRLRELMATDEVTRFVELVHLGDGHDDGVRGAGGPGDGHSVRVSKLPRARAETASADMPLFAYGR